MLDLSDLSFFCFCFFAFLITSRCEQQALTHLSSSCCSSVHPTRHYTVFLSEDSSGDELHYDNEAVSCFPDTFLLSVPFDWSPLYASLITFALLSQSNLFFCPHIFFKRILCVFWSEVCCKIVTEELRGFNSKSVHVL